MISEIVEFFMGPLLKVNIEQVVAETIDEHDDDIEELQRAQFAAGQMGDGTPIKPGYKAATVKSRKKQGLQTDHVDYKQKGGFYAGTFAKRTNGGTEISSADDKTPFLVKRSGEGIFGLTVASREELENRMRPTLQDKFNAALT